MRKYILLSMLIVLIALAIGIKRNERRDKESISADNFIPERNHTVVRTIVRGDRGLTDDSYIGTESVGNGRSDGMPDGTGEDPTGYKAGNDGTLQMVSVVSTYGCEPNDESESEDYLWDDQYADDVCEDMGEQPGTNSDYEEHSESDTGDTVDESEYAGNPDDQYADDESDGYSDGYSDDWDDGQSDISEGSEDDGTGEDYAEDTGGAEAGLTYLGEYTISFYCPCEICCGEWATGCTASGVPATAWHTVASGQFEFGTELYIDGLGYFVVEDRGVDGNWIDVFCGNHDEALALGLQNRGVYLVG